MRGGRAPGDRRGRRLRRGPGARRSAAALWLVATLPLLAPPRARADLIGDALRCLEEQGALEARRSGLLREADSLGGRMEAARRERGGAADLLLRRAERLQREAFDLELELVDKRELCRQAAARALQPCEERLRALERALNRRQARPEDAAELLRLREVRSRLREGIAGPAVLGFPLLPPDSADTQQSLQAKLQYHEEVRDHLHALSLRVRARATQLRDERRTLVEARRFLEELGFLDEGGRVTPGGNARFRGLPGNGELPDESAARLGGGVDVSGRGAELDLLLVWTPATPEESERLERLLRTYAEAIDRELKAVEQTMQAIRARILPVPGASP